MNNKYKTLDQFRNSKWNTLEVALMKIVGKKNKRKVYNSWFSRYNERETADNVKKWLRRYDIKRKRLEIS